LLHIAAYIYHGFLVWSVFEGAASGSNVEHFIRAKLARYKNADSISFCDNASVNKVDKVLVALDEVFGGFLVFLEVYSPQLAPVELGFSNIREYIRSRVLTKPFNITLFTKNRADEPLVEIGISI